MAAHGLTARVRNWFRPVRTMVENRRFLPRVERLGERVLPAVTATFTAAGGTLRILGDETDNTIMVSRDAAGTLLVNNGAIAIQGGAATVANTSLVFINGVAGNDTLAVNLAGASTPAAFFGGAGD